VVELDAGIGKLARENIDEPDLDRALRIGARGADEERDSAANSHAGPIHCRPPGLLGSVSAKIVLTNIRAVENVPRRDGGRRPTLIAAAAMLPICILALLLVLSWFGGQAARAEPAASNAPRIEWEAKNRFRLFRNEADFQRHVEATRSDGVLAAERRLAKESDGRGWARDTVERLCVYRTG